MMRQLRYMVFLLMSGLTACAQDTDIDSEVKRLYRNTVPVLRNEAVRPGLTVLDAREREEFDVSHLSGAIWVGHDDFDISRVAGMDRHDTVIVYCSIGYRSERVGEKLLKAGFTNVFNLYGGIFRWKNHDGVVVTASGDTTERVHCYNRSWSRFLSKGEKVY